MSTRARPLSPDTEFIHLVRGERRVAFTATEFWRWGFSNVRENVTRGILAEFIVARALGIELTTRQAFDRADLVTAEGVTIEVKSSGFLQAWGRRKPAAIRYPGLRSRLWTPGIGTARTSEYHCDLYVFCLHSARDDDAYDPLNLDQWDFWVVSRAVLAATRSRTLRLGALQRLGVGPVRYDALKGVVEAVVAESKAV